MSCTHPEGCCCGASEWNRLVEELEEAREELAKLSTPLAVQINMLRGTIAKISFEQWKHIEGLTESPDAADLHSSLSTAERERDEARAACALKDGALERNAGTFHMYASHHEAKNTDEGRKRASVNAKLAMECEEALAPNPGAALVERLGRAEERLETERDYIKKMDAVIDDMRVANSCINPLEDLKRAIAKLKGDRDAALSRCRELEGVLQTASEWLGDHSYDGIPKWVFDKVKEALSTPPQPEQKLIEFVGPPVDFRKWWDSRDWTFGGDATPLSIAGMAWEAAHRLYVLEQKTQTVPVEEVPDWLLKRTFAVQYSPNCPKRWLVRLPGKSAVIDLKPYHGTKPETGDAIGFGETLAEAASESDAAYRSAQAIGGRVE